MNRRDLAEKVIARAKELGANESAVQVGHSRSVEISYRDGQLEKLQEAQSSSLEVELYVDGRYSAHGTSDLRWPALDAFLERAVALTRMLGEDPYRALPDPKLYEGRFEGDLNLLDEGYESVATTRRRELAQEVEAQARAVPGPIISVTAGYSDEHSEYLRLHSNGFAGVVTETGFSLGASVAVEDEDGRKPSDWHWATHRHLADVPSPAELGQEAARRALSRLGQDTLPSGNLTLVIENRTAPQLVSHLLRAAYGSVLQQKSSFLLDKLGQKVGSDVLTLVDDPFIPKALGSRTFDGDGISTRRRALVQKGVLEEYLIDVYYGRKLGVAPTGGSASNLTLVGGKGTARDLIKQAHKGVYVTGFLGGNSDITRGDFSHGILGYAIENGEIGRPVGEMNITGSHTDLWHRLVAVGEDGYQYSSSRMPTLVLEGVSTSGVG